MKETLCRWPNKMAAMDQPRSGHGCSHLTADGGHVIVTGRHVSPIHVSTHTCLGGSRSENSEALASSEVYNVATNTWSPGPDMVHR